MDKPIQQRESYSPLFHYVRDWALPLAAFLICATTSMITTSRSGHFAFAILLWLFILPGWAIAPLIRTDINTLERLLFGSLLSFIAYSFFAYICELSGLGFDGFYIAYGAYSLFTLGISLRISSVESTIFLKKNWLPLLQGIALIIFLSVLYRYPYGSDIGQFIGQQIDYATARNFQISAYGMESFGIESAMPRLRAHYYHIFPVLFADILDVKPHIVIQELAPAPLAILIFTSLITFLRTIAGKHAGFGITAFSIIGPLCLLAPADYTVHDRTFRLVNAPTLDKDFCLFYLLPATLTLAIWFLKSKELRYFNTLCLSSLAFLFFHPLTLVYFILALIGLFAGYYHRAIRELGMLTVFAGVIFVTALLLGNAQSHHQDMNALIIHSFEQTQILFYGPDHYSIIPGISSTGISWFNGVAFLGFSLIREPTLLLTLLATVIWLLLLTAKKRSQSREDPFEEGEREALGVHLGFTGILLLLFVAAPLFLLVFPQFHRGYERLHWGYYGYLSLVFLEIKVQALLQRMGQIGKAILQGLTLCFFILLVDQTQALILEGKTLVGRFPLIRTLADHPADNGRSFPLQAKYRDHSYYSGFFKDNRPPWLLEEDVVLTVLPYDYQLQKQAIYWRELYGEAFALATFGSSFFDTYDAFYDLVMLQASGRLACWIIDKQVTVLQVDSEAHPQDKIDSFMSALERRLPVTLTQVAQGTYRITWQKQSS